MVGFFIGTRVTPGFEQKAGVLTERLLFNFLSHGATGFIFVRYNKNLESASVSVFFR
jgi:hypothetical protein